MTTTFNKEDSSEKTLLEQNQHQEASEKEETKKLGGDKYPKKIGKFYQRILFEGAKGIFKGIVWLFFGGGKVLVLGGGFSLVWTFYQQHDQSLQFQQQAVENYIETVKTLIFDQLHASEKQPKIRYKDIQIFVKAQAGTTFMQLNDCRYQNQLISFLRDAKIGFLPRNSSEPLTDRDKEHTRFLRGIDLTEVNLNNANLEKAVFQEAFLSKARLKRAELAESDLRKAFLNEAELNGANLINANLTGANLRKANLSKSYVQEQAFKILFLSLPHYYFLTPKPTNLEHANLRGAKLQGVDLRGANLTNVNLIDTDLRDAEPLKGENFKESIPTQLKGVTLTYALYVPEQTKFPKSFKKEGKTWREFADDRCMIPIGEKLNIPELLKKPSCTLNKDKDVKVTENLSAFSNTDLSRLNLKRAQLSDIDFSQSNLQRTELQEANLKGANFQDANFQGANLKGAMLDHANLKGVNFDELKDEKGQTFQTTVDDKWRLVADIVSNRLKDKNLVGKDLSNANLQEANLQETKLQGANFQKADLTGANLRGATGFNQNGVILCRTILPDGKMDNRDCTTKSEGKN